MINKKGKKTNFVPFTTDGKTSVVMWDFQPVFTKDGNETEVGTWKMEKFNKKLSHDEIKTFITEFYNKKIDEKILMGMVWKGMKIWLSSENQFNYKAAYDLAVQTNGKNLPVMFKFGETNEPIYYTFQTIEELSDFYMSSMQFIQMTLEEGWRLKDSINWEEYKVF
jgi:hypothetical protein